MNNAAQILKLIADGILAVREVLAIFEAAVSAAKQINAEGREITDADLASLRTERSAALDRLKSRLG